MSENSSNSAENVYKHSSIHRDESIKDDDDSGESKEHESSFVFLDGKSRKFKKEIEKMIQKRYDES